jgi:hypothetical protein
VEYSVELNMSDQRAFAPGIQLNAGEFYDGDRKRARIGFEWRPDEHFSLNWSYDFPRSEQSYLYRIRTGEPMPRPENEPPLTLAEMTESLRASGAGLIEWASQVQTGDTVQIKWYDGSLHDVPKAIILNQAINHATEHRSQVMSILTQLGIEPPDLDSWTYFDQLVG